MRKHLTQVPYYLLDKCWKISEPVPWHLLHICSESLNQYHSSFWINAENLWAGTMFPFGKMGPEKYPDVLATKDENFGNYVCEHVRCASALTPYGNSIRGHPCAFWPVAVVGHQRELQISLRKCMLTWRYSNAQSNRTGIRDHEVISQRNGTLFLRCCFFALT